MEKRRAAQGTTGPTPAAEPDLPLYDFVRQAWHVVEPDQPYIDGLHILALCTHLEAVTLGDIRDLLINVPPGHCKSLLCCVFWPAWVWTFNPSARWLFASYGQELSTRDSLRCRYILKSPWYQERWGERFQLINDQDQKTRYDTDRRGWRIATSVGGRGTGEHPHFIVTDDPHNTKQAESDAERQAALEWWDGTIASRGRILGVRRVVIMQRLHECDLSAHILGKGGFTHVCLPMEFEPGRMRPTPLGWTDWRQEPGELLWPEAFPPDTVAQLKRDLGGLRAAGQLQQRPVPLEGGMFKRLWLSRVVDEPPEGAQWLRFWDLAATPNGGDYSAGVLMGRSLEGAYYVADVRRGQWSADERNRIMRQTAEADRQRFGDGAQVGFELQPGSAGKESGEFLIRYLAGFNVYAERSTGGKDVRAMPLAAQCEAGNVFLVRGEWNAAYVDELCAFPNGQKDDQVDGSSGAFNRLASKGGPWEFSVSDPRESLYARMPREEGYRDAARRNDPYADPNQEDDPWAVSLPGRF
jgi:predicted phage terminase large subunit-like protein